jgi:hypothetical protein
MKGLAPYIAAGFAAALAVTSLEFSLAGSSQGTSSLGSPRNLPHSSAAASAKGDLLEVRPAAAATQKVSTVELVGLHDATIVLLRDATGQVLYRSDPMSGITVVSKGVVLPQVTIREIDQAWPREEPAESVRQPSALPEVCDPAVGPLAAASASDFGVRCLTAREDEVKVAVLFD